MKPQLIKQIKFKDYYLNLYLGKYMDNNRYALMAKDAHTDEEFGVFTKNFPEVALDTDQVIVPGNYSEHVGKLQALIDNNIIGTPLSGFDHGYGTYYICNLYPNVIKP